MQCWLDCDPDFGDRGDLETCKTLIAKDSYPLDPSERLAYPGSYSCSKHDFEILHVLGLAAIQRASDDCRLTLLYVDNAFFNRFRNLLSS